MSRDTDLRNVVADLAAAYFRNSHVRPSEIATVINRIAASLSAVGAPAAEPPPETAVQLKLSPARIRASVTRDALVSFEDKKPYKSLRRHLAARGLSPEEYRSKWGLPKDYPMEAPAYSEARSSLAKARGFGRSTALNAAPEPTSNTGLTEPASAAPLAAADAPTEARQAPERVPSIPSTPSAFRPLQSIRDPEARTRHGRWLSMLSKADWARIRAIARQVNPAHVPAALTDLSAPLRVRACMVGQVGRFPGEHVGTLRGGQVAVLMSEHGDH